MKNILLLWLAAMAVFVLGSTGIAKEGGKKSGEALFKENCSPCHPDGGNIVNPKKTLMKKDREANKIKKQEDIVKFMRNPGPGMTKFDDKTLSDRDAKEIAEYILKTFK